MKKLLAVLVAGFIAGCAMLNVTGSAVPTGEKRAPISPQQVKMYRALPANALTVGTVQVVASESMDQNIGVMELVFPELAKQAASIGANGIIPKSRKVDPATGSETHIADAVYVPN
jgi:hypothetical protein